MTFQSFGQENTVWGGGQEYIEMQPRQWYFIPSGTLIENQFTRPLAISYEQPALMAAPNNAYDSNWQYQDPKPNLLSTNDLVWPSDHFRKSITTFTINAGQLWKAGRDCYIMSTHYRKQVIDTSGYIFADWTPVSENDITEIVYVRGTNGSTQIISSDDLSNGIEIDGVTYATDVDGLAITQSNLVGGMILAAPVLVDDGTPEVGEYVTVIPPIVAGTSVSDVNWTYSTNSVNNIEGGPWPSSRILIDAADGSIVVTATMTGSGRSAA